MSDLTRHTFIAGLGGLLAAPQLKGVPSACVPVHFIQLDGALLAAHAARSFDDDDAFIKGVRRQGEITFTLDFKGHCAL